jgi:hypothetical protein
MAKRHDGGEQKRGNTDEDRPRFHDKFPTPTEFGFKNNIPVTEPGVRAGIAFRPICRSLAGVPLAHAPLLPAMLRASPRYRRALHRCFDPPVPQAVVRLAEGQC